jgi:hypothetical protein
MITAFLKVTDSYWAELFSCSEMANLPRTNSELEHSFGSANKIPLSDSTIFALPDRFNYVAQRTHASAEGHVQEKHTRRIREIR